MKYSIDYSKLREGIEELMKMRVNSVLDHFDHGGLFPLDSILDNYLLTKQLAIRFGLNTTNYDNKVNELLEKTGIGARV